MKTAVSQPALASNHPHEAVKKGAWPIIADRENRYADRFASVAIHGDAATPLPQPVELV